MMLWLQLSNAEGLTELSSLISLLWGLPPSHAALSSSSSLSHLLHLLHIHPMPPDGHKKPLLLYDTAGWVIYRGVYGS